jgi:hypothetical protein
MKILLAYCGLMVQTIQKMSEAEGAQIITAGTYEEAKCRLTRGVDALITNVQMPQQKLDSPNPASISHPTCPWGVVLALAAQKRGIPVTIVFDQLTWRERMEFVERLFKQFGQPVPDLAKLYAGGNKKQQREVYIGLRKRMKAKEAKVKAQLAHLNDLERKLV